MQTDLVRLIFRIAKSAEFTKLPGCPTTYTAIFQADESTASKLSAEISLG